MRRSSHFVRVVLIAVLAAGLVLAGSGSALTATDGESPNAGRTWIVDAIDDAYGNRFESRDTGSSEVTIEVGDTVEWRFEWPTAVQEHDLTSADTPTGTWKPAVQEYRVPDDPQGPVTHTFTEPGTYHYRCSIHGTTMSGTVVVKDPSESGDILTVDAVASPTTGPAPLDVAFTGVAEGAQGDGGGLTYAWDFGDGTTAVGPHHGHAYASAGSYTATLTASDADGRTGTDSVGITVTEGHSHHALPTISATGTPTSGTTPLTVAFSAEVTTTGSVKAFANGSTSYPDITGTATMVRRRGATYTSLDVSGLKAGAMHMVHVHEEACASNNGGAHFRFDKSQPFAEANEIWLPFTSDAHGRSGPVAVTRPQRAAADAVSIVIHDPDNPAQRIGCVDLAPGTDGLVYDWDFGDGSTGQGTDPDHVYAKAGTYRATVTVADPHGNTVTDSMSVSTTEAAPPPSGAGPVPIDVQPPDTGLTGGPRGVVRARRAVFGFTSTEGASTFTCSLDGGAWQVCPANGTFRGLSEGRHRLLVRATDPAGNTDATPVSRAWTVDRTGPGIRQVRPVRATVDRTPAVRARVMDDVSRVRIVLRVDGDRVGPVRHVGRHRMVWKPTRALAFGRHTVRLVLTDAAGNRSSRTWQFRVRR